ncbi:unnamed protein product [Peniophora sp. CBMAI 1063]|nr:unnamed protein product [Peniophora sp. CBMAI 1063]
MASAGGPGKLSREEYRRQKDLDAARKAGTAPYALDEEGKAINPHIPQYISQVPWYADTGKPTLSHQRKPVEEKDPNAINDWYDRGAKGSTAKKYRKGACENCGALTHKRKDCLERPRKKGAKFTNKDIAPDEIVRDIELGYDAKRDRWNGYDPGEHKKVYEEYEAIEAERQRQREEEIDNQTTTDLAAVRKVAKAGKAKEEDPDFGSSEDEDADEDKYADSADAVGQKMDTKTRITVRNLRIREDTAKYLINLDPESAYYDPKTRSMRENPLNNVPPEEARFAGDNFLRYSGEAPEVAAMQIYAWQAEQRGHDVHLNANPTQGQLLHKQHKSAKEEMREVNKGSILAKYGGAEYLEGVPKELLEGQTEEYVEYDRTGKVVKGRERVKVRSKYAEDVYMNNHTAVWGSWYDRDTGVWGYACCHSSIHASYCTGAAGIEAAKESSAQALLSKAMPPPPVPDYTESDRKGKGRAMDTDSESLVDGLADERKRKARGEDGDRFAKKSKGDDTRDAAKLGVSESELESYRMKRPMMEDPMANYVDSEI